MGLNTTSELISLCREIEEDGARFYENLAERYPDGGETWLSFAKENRKNIVQIERVYYGMITDALEGCFAFNIDPDKYDFQTELLPGESYTDVLNKSIDMENEIKKFYSDAAEQSNLLMADIPRALVMLSKKRDSRVSFLKSLLDKEVRYR